MLHKAKRRTTAAKTVKETEAEAIAFVVGNAVGLEPGSASATGYAKVPGKENRRQTEEAPKASIRNSRRKRFSTSTMCRHRLAVSNCALWCPVEQICLARFLKLSYPLAPHVRNISWIVLSIERIHRGLICYQRINSI